MAAVSLWGAASNHATKLALQETLRTILLISSNCLITSKALFKASSPTWLKPIHQGLFKSGNNALCHLYLFHLINSHRAGSIKCKWQSQYALVRGLSNLQRPKLHAGPWGEEVKKSTSCTPQPDYLNPEQTLGNCTTKAQLATTPWILSSKRWTCHLSNQIFASHEFYFHTPFHISCPLFLFSYDFIFRWMQINAKWSFKYALA